MSLRTLAPAALALAGLVALTSAGEARTDGARVHDHRGGASRVIVDHRSGRPGLTPPSAGVPRPVGVRPPSAGLPSPVTQRPPIVRPPHPPHRPHHHGHRWRRHAPWVVVSAAPVLPADCTWVWQRRFDERRGIVRRVRVPICE